MRPLILPQEFLPSEQLVRVMTPLILPEENLSSEQVEGDDTASVSNILKMFFTKINQKINVGV